MLSLKGGAQMRKATSVLLLMLLACTFMLMVWGCNLYNVENIYADGLCYTLNAHKKVCFAGAFAWDGENMVIEVADEIERHPVTSLGGYTGKGVSNPFSVHIEGVHSTWSEGALPSGARIRQLHFTVNIGKNVEELKNIEMKDYYQIGDTREFYQILVTVNCAEKNQTFYSRNGKLYRSSDDSLVECFYYFPDYTETH